jgi:hypothetical protein
MAALHEQEMRAIRDELYQEYRGRLGQMAQELAMAHQQELRQLWSEREEAMRRRVKEELLAELKPQLTTVPATPAPRPTVQPAAAPVVEPQTDHPVQEPAQSKSSPQPTTPPAKAIPSNAREGTPTIPAEDDYRAGPSNPLMPRRRHRPRI